MPNRKHPDLGSALDAIESALPAEWPAQPTFLPEGCEWSACTQLQRFVLCKCFGRGPQRAQVRAAVQARAQTGLTWMELACAIWPDNDVRRAVVARIQYWNRD
jgi:hypothetical protein